MALNKLYNMAGFFAMITFAILVVETILNSFMNMPFDIKLYTAFVMLMFIEAVATEWQLGIVTAIELVLVLLMFPQISLIFWIVIIAIVAYFLQPRLRKMADTPRGERILAIMAHFHRDTDH